ncbi:MAG: DHH family phosphoesterase [Thermoplasmata archaeon]|nr:DHH family phosphoesterase [Candidatus Sysuiplasma acidicola]
MKEIKSGSAHSASSMARLLADGTPSVIALHPGADVDCLASAYALSSSFHIDYLWAPYGLDRIASAEAELHGIRTNEGLLPSSARRVIFVDTSESRISEYPGIENMEIVIIDHHQMSGNSAAHAFLINQESPSCSEIIIEVLEAAGFAPAKEAAELLVLGMVFDTGRFRRGGASTLRKCAAMLEIAQTRLDDLVSRTESARERSEQTAILKGLQRMVFRTAGGYTVCCSHTSSYESSVASALLGAGCDVAFVGSSSDGAVRVTGRTGPRMAGASINLVALFRQIAAGFGGTCGGHAGAAVLNTEGELEAILNSCAAECLEQIGMPANCESADTHRRRVRRQ